jgi:hypothetical protein
VSTLSKKTPRGKRLRHDAANRQAPAPILDRHCDRASPFKPYPKKHPASSSPIERSGHRPRGKKNACNLLVITNILTETGPGALQRGLVSHERRQKEFS